MTAPSDLSFYHLTERYPDEDSAEQYFVAHRWPQGVRCPSCKSADVLRADAKSRKRPIWLCHGEGCGRQFSVTTGTIMEDTKLPLRKWLLAFHLMGSSKKGMSALQVSRMLHTGYRAAWHLCHRIRATMTNDSQLFTGIVETDELYVGGKRKGRGRGYRGNKMAVQTIVKRNRRGQHDSQAQTIALNNGQKVDGRTVGAKLRTHTDPEKTVLMTDDSPIYTAVGKEFADHHVVNHSKEEYARCDPDGHLATTNTAEGLFANLRRQITGTHHSVGKKHLPRYLEEFDFKYNHRNKTDTERTSAAIRNMEGKRLTLYKKRGAKGVASLFNHHEGDPRADYVSPEGVGLAAGDLAVKPRKRNRKRGGATVCPVARARSAGAAAERSGAEGTGKAAKPRTKRAPEPKKASEVEVVRVGNSPTRKGA